MGSVALSTAALIAQRAAETVEPPRSWWPWLAGFLPGLIVVAALVLTLRWLRNRSTDSDR